MIYDCWTHNFSFSEFVHITGSCNRDRHWVPQHSFVDDWSVINFAIHFKNLSRGTERLLRKLGNDVWQKFGRDGWGLDGNCSICWENSRRRFHAELNMDKYYTPELEKIVEEIFSDDYQFLHEYFPGFY